MNKGLILFFTIILTSLTLAGCSKKIHPLKGESKHKICTELRHKLIFRDPEDRIPEELPTDRAHLLQEYKRYNCQENNSS